MPTTTQPYNLFIKLLIATGSVLLLSFFSQTAFAQTSAQTVTATVPDLHAPSTPILISPDDDSVITTAYPPFVWRESTDNVAIDYYELTVDGSVLFTNIPATATDNSQYTLTYDNNTGYYTLTPKNPLGDGNHTWNVTVYDTVGNLASSVTWNFVIDTLAPYLEITQIGNQTVLIHTGDAGTVPDDPIHLPDNEPQLSGSGEAGSTVQLTITIPGDPTQNHSFNVDQNGSWAFQAGIFPRDVVITLDFVITDSSGNISVITGLQLIIDPIIIIFPPTSPSPTPSVLPSPSPLPSTQPVASPGTTSTPLPDSTPSPSTPPPDITPIPTPTPVSSPLLTIELLPPREIVYEAVQEMQERIPEEILDLLALIPESIVTVISAPLKAISPAGALVATIAVPSLTLLAFFLQSGAQLSFELLIKLLQALGLLPVKEPQGMVYNSENNTPIPFALLTIQSTDSNDELFETVVSDEDGIYQGVKLPRGTYSITVSHQEFIFPTAKPRPYYLTQTEYYRGEPFSVQDTEKQQLFLIPVDPKKELDYKKTKQSKIRLFAARMRLKNIIVPMFVVSLVFMLINPTVINIFIVGLYLVVFMIKISRRLRKAPIIGTVTDTAGKPISDAIIRLNNSITTELVSLVTTNKRGTFAIHCKPGRYYLRVTKTEYVRESSESVMGLDEVLVADNQVSVPLILQRSVAITASETIG